MARLSHKMYGPVVELIEIGLIDPPERYIGLIDCSWRNEGSRQWEQHSPFLSW